MEKPHTGSQRPNYGIDAPGLVLRFLLIGIAGTGLGVALIIGLRAGLSQWMRFAVPPALTLGVWFLLTAMLMLWGSRFGKLQLRDNVIDAISWRGDEFVLDVGCGHGLMLIAAAKRLRGGKAIGIDLWQREDQSGNSRAATWQNVELENVADRVELLDGDARSLPFDDDYFDVVLSTWAFHNIYDEPGRAAAIREIARVLKPGGSITIVDIRHTRQYAQILRQCGMTGIHRSWPNFMFFIPSYTLTARKGNGG